jgi:hypothetical protein
MTAPRLHRRDLETDLARIYGVARDHLLVAFHGSGDADVLEVHGAKVAIVPVRGELELRRRLLDVHDGERVAFLVPWTVAMPLDLQGRFAKSGRVFRIGREVRLRNLFGAAEVDGVHGSPLVDYLLEHHADERFAIGGGRLTVDAMWAAWLDQAWGVGCGGELALDVLLGWAATDGHGARFVAAMASGAGAAVRTELLTHLERKLGPAGPLVWRAWEAGRGTATLELALVLGALGPAVTGDDVVAMWVRTAAPLVVGHDAPVAALQRLGEAADTALRDVARRHGIERVRRLLLAADARATDPALRPHLIASARLPSAWRARLERLGDGLAAVAAAPTAAGAQDVIERLRALRRHELADLAEQTLVVRRAEMAARLACWLATRADRALPPATTPFGDVEALAGWYVREGGYLDWARLAARGVGDDPFGRGVAAVLAAVDAARLELDRRFARALPAWHDARRQATQVVPIDQAVKRLLAPFLDGDPERRVLVVLMDGMAWAQAAELLESMGQRASAWGPLAWHGLAGNRLGDAPFPPVLTNFPSLTEVSRAGFFAGKPMPAGPSPSTQDDPKRWRAHRDLRKVTDPAAEPLLLLRGDGQTADGSATPEALSMVLDRTRRVVAVVINAIDMSLKTDAAHQHTWTLDTVKSLAQLLDRATEAGRAVLLCSDHGHVPSARLVAGGRPEDCGARWRPWPSPTAPVAEHEVGLAATEGVWAPRGAHGVVLQADDTKRYGSGTGAGEHGGASLAEAIAPCLFIGCRDHHASQDDPGQAVRPARAPAWWNLDVGAAIVDGEPGDARPSRRKRPAADAQLALVGVAPPTPPTPPTPATRRAPLASPLATSPLLVARVPNATERDRVVAAVEFLRSRNGVAAAAAFAAELGEFTARVGGLVSRLQEAVNVDGYQVLRYDRDHQQVHLDVGKLAQQFELTW